MELLARSALSYISPTLLAETEKEHRHLRYSLNLNTNSNTNSQPYQPLSINTTQVFTLCKLLISEFKECYNTAISITIKRNEELHTGSAAFSEYNSNQWISGFFMCCKVLTKFQNKSLIDFLGEEIHKEAAIILVGLENEIKSKTEKAISSHRTVFDNKDDLVKARLKAEAQTNSNILATRGHHRVDCPACLCMATIFGEPSGKERTENHENEIIVRQTIIPTKFDCTACELKLNGYKSLSVVNLATHYTRTILYSPEEYYNLIHPDDVDSIKEHYLSHKGYNEWNNE